MFTSFWKTLKSIVQEQSTTSTVEKSEKKSVRCCNCNMMLDPQDDPSFTNVIQQRKNITPSNTKISSVTGQDNEKSRDTLDLGDHIIVQRQEGKNLVTISNPSPSKNVESQKNTVVTRSTTVSNKTINDVTAYCPYKNYKFKCRRMHIYYHIRNSHLQNLPPIKRGSYCGRRGTVPMLQTSDRSLINILLVGGITESTLSGSLAGMLSRVFFLNTAVPLAYCVFFETCRSIANTSTVSETLSLSFEPSAVNIQQQQQQQQQQQRQQRETINNYNDDEKHFNNKYNKQLVATYIAYSWTIVLLVTNITYCGIYSSSYTSSTPSAIRASMSLYGISQFNMYVLYGPGPFYDSTSLWISFALVDMVGLMGLYYAWFASSNGLWPPQPKTALTNNNAQTNYYSYTQFGSSNLTSAEQQQYVGQPPQIFMATTANQGSRSSNHQLQPGEQYAILHIPMSQSHQYQQYYHQPQPSSSTSGPFVDRHNQ
ncbi:hypothetical protein BDA99DRAFT_565253 [Phascolomyces articulosus]|uniref:Uncharacterized protein n=1 Tax=Phascolomyces articulosus TaxID=60185 RepID=A0AAD5JNK2_9FUNG|nr:hypothetical protein BDA99DRAFT_565253 [Phascolomyces articulosus]